MRREKKLEKNKKRKRGYNNEHLTKQFEEDTNIETLQISLLLEKERLYTVRKYHPIQENQLLGEIRLCNLLQDL